MKPINDRSSNPSTPFNPVVGEIVTPATLESVPGAISTLQSAAEFFNKCKDMPIVTLEMVKGVSKLRAACNDLNKGLDEFEAALKEAFGKANAGDDPVWVYRYQDADGKEGFVLKDEPDAESKARRLDADKMIELGYAYPDKNNPGKFVGFVVTKNIDGTDRSKY